jgi:hypothetical protein
MPANFLEPRLDRMRARMARHASRTLALLCMLAWHRKVSSPFRRWPVGVAHATPFISAGDVAPSGVLAPMNSSPGDGFLPRQIGFS